MQCWRLCCSRHAAGDMDAAPPAPQSSDNEPSSPRSARSVRSPSIRSNSRTASPDSVVVHISGEAEETDDLEGDEHAASSANVDEESSPTTSNVCAESMFPRKVNRIFGRDYCFDAQGRKVLFSRLPPLARVPIAERPTVINHKIFQCSYLFGETRSVRTPPAQTRSTVSDRSSPSATTRKSIRSLSRSLNRRFRNKTSSAGNAASFGNEVDGGVQLVHEERGMKAKTKVLKDMDSYFGAHAKHVFYLTDENISAMLAMVRHNLGQLPARRDAQFEGQEAAMLRKEDKTGMRGLETSSSPQSVDHADPSFEQRQHVYILMERLVKMFCAPKNLTRAQQAAKDNFFKAVLLRHCSLFNLLCARLESLDRQERNQTAKTMMLLWSCVDADVGQALRRCVKFKLCGFIEEGDASLAFPLTGTNSYAGIAEGICLYRQMEEGQRAPQVQPRPRLSPWNTWMDAMASNSSNVPFPYMPRRRQVSLSMLQSRVSAQQRQMFKTLFIPLLRGSWKDYRYYHDHLLIAIVETFDTHDGVDLLPELCRGLFRYWPLQCPSKQALLMDTLEEVLTLLLPRLYNGRLSEEQLLIKDRAHRTLLILEDHELDIQMWTKIVNPAVSSPHFGLSTRALAFLRAASVMSLLIYHSEVLLPLMYPAMVDVYQHHLHPMARVQARTIMQFVQSSDNAAYSRILCKMIQDRDGRAQQAAAFDELRNSSWQKLLDQERASLDRAAAQRSRSLEEQTDAAWSRLHAHIRIPLDDGAVQTNFPRPRSSDSPSCGLSMDPMRPGTPRTSPSQLLRSRLTMDSLVDPKLEFSHMDTMLALLHGQLGYAPPPSGGPILQGLLLRDEMHQDKYRLERAKEAELRGTQDGQDKLTDFTEVHQAWHPHSARHCHAAHSHTHAHDLHHDQPQHRLHSHAHSHAHSLSHGTHPLTPEQLHSHEHMPNHNSNDAQTCLPHHYPQLHDQLRRYVQDLDGDKPAPQTPHFFQPSHFQSNKPPQAHQHHQHHPHQERLQSNHYRQHHDHHHQDMSFQHQHHHSDAGFFTSLDPPGHEPHSDIHRHDNHPNVHHDQTQAISPASISPTQIPSPLPAPAQTDPPAQVLEEAASPNVETGVEPKPPQTSLLQQLQLGTHKGSV